MFLDCTITIFPITYCFTLESWKLKTYRDLISRLGFPGGSDGKESACNAEDPGSIPESRRSPGEENGILAWRMPWTEESMGSQRVIHDWVTNTHNVSHFLHWFSTLDAHWNHLGALQTLMPESTGDCDASDLGRGPSTRRPASSSDTLMCSHSQEALLCCNLLEIRKLRSRAVNWLASYHTAS